MPIFTSLDPINVYCYNRYLITTYDSGLQSGINLDLLSNTRPYATIVTQGPYSFVRSSQYKSLTFGPRAARLITRNPRNTFFLKAKYRL